VIEISMGYQQNFLSVEFDEDAKEKELADDP
jgi:hypothetical protein